MQDGPDLYTVSYDRLAVWKYNDVAGGTAIKTHVATFEQAREGLSANIINRKRIVMVGGRSDSNNYCNNTHWLDLETKEFSNGPAINTARYTHSSTLLGPILYIFGGLVGYQCQDTFEKLDVTDPNAQWVQFTINGITPR